MARSGRKRKRSPTLQEEQEEVENTEHQANPDPEVDADGEEVALEQKRELWDAFKEEHHEAVEQLPLYLHRTYRLIKDLDVQTQAYQVEVFRLLSEYIEVRQRLHRAPDAISPSSHLDDGVLPDDGIPVQDPTTGQSPGSEPTTMLQGNGLECSPQGQRPLTLLTDCPSAGGAMPTHDDAARTHMLMTRTAVLLDSWVRAGDEKVNLAKAAYDSTDRHVRILDSDITEQEKHGEQTAGEDGTPRKPTLNDDSDTGENGIAIGITEASSRMRATTRRAGKQSNLRGSTRKRGTAPLPNSKPLTQAVTRSHPAKEVIDMDVLPNEPVYCYCRNVSHGLMIACDNKNCAREWFHYGCVGLVEAPKGQAWYCPDCTEALGRHGRRKRN